MSDKTKWILRKNKSSHLNPSDYESLKKQLMQNLDLGSRAAEILINRGMDSVLQTKRYLNPSLDDLHDPFFLMIWKKL
jgi:hypothetical protein